MENQPNGVNNNTQNNMGNGYNQPNMQNGYYTQQGQYYGPNMQGQYYGNNMQNGYNYQQNNLNKKNVFAILSIVFAGVTILMGILFRVSISTSTISTRSIYGLTMWALMLVLVALPMGIAALVLGILGVVKADKYASAQSYRIMAIIGIVGSVVGSIMTIGRWI